MAVVDVSTEVIIDRPVDVVADFVSDPTNAPRWYRNIESVSWLTDPPVRVGSMMSFVAHFLGRRLAYTYEVVEMESGARLVMRTNDGPFPMETTYLWSAVNAGQCRMRLLNRGEPGGFASVGARMLESSMRRANEKDLVTLKQVLETA